ncbi:MAG TPA: ATP-binding protein, partial [Acidimicrobiales bacterium]|nr:ATP-binding protein [Acidimicrobiales bacterium]
IVQEALTNVLKHGGPVPTTVVVRYRPSDVELEIADRGTVAAGTPATEGPGHGLVGMRERVAMFGGQLDAGPRPDGGFAVVARLPITTRAS